MKKYLLTLIVLVCAVTGAWAITIGTVTDGAVTISNVSAGELASADLSSVAAATSITVTGELNDADLQALSAFSSANYVDLSGITIASGATITSAKFTAGSPNTGVRTEAAILLPTTTTTTDVYAFQQTGNTVAYFTAINELSVASEKAAVQYLASAVTTSTRILLAPKYDNTGAMDASPYLTPNTQNQDTDFITHLGALHAASIDFTWMNGSDITNMASQLVNLSNDTHYLVIPSNNSSTYNANWDPTKYTYNSNVWAVSTYFGTATPYSMQGDFGGRQYSSTFYSSQTYPFSPDESAQAGNFTKILQSGHLSDIFSYMSAQQKSAGVSAFYGEITSADMAAITATNCSSKYIDFSRATFNGTTIAALPSTAVNYIELPYDTDITTLSASNFKSNVKEAVAVDVTNGNMYGYSSATSNGTLEHILAYDNKWQETVSTGVYTVTGTLKLEGTYNDVFGTAYQYGNANQKLQPVTLDLSAASFPSFTSNIFKYNAQLTDKNTKNASGNELFRYTTTYSVSSGNESAACSVDNNFDCEGNGLANLYTMNSTLTSVSLPTDANTTTLPSMSFYNCSGITGTLTVPANFKTIGAAVFGGCSHIETLDIEGATLMGVAACANMAALSTAALPGTLEKIPDFCFTVCTSLMTIDLPEGLKYIGIGAFKANSGATTQIRAIRFPNTLERIECEAFVENHYLTVLSFPASLQYIGTACFNNSQHITDVYFLGTTPPVIEKDAFDGRTTGQGQGRTNSTYETTCDGKKAVSRYYYNGNADASTVTGFADDRAILHYPKVAQEASYASTATTFTAEEAAAYNAAQAADAVTLYTDAECTTPLTGTAEAGTTYYKKTTTEASTGTETSKSVSGVTTYYSASTVAANEEATPKISCSGGTNYYYENGTTPVWQSTQSPVDGVSQYYSSQNITATVTPTLNTTYYYMTGNTVDVYSSTYAPVANVSTYYTDNTGNNTVAPELADYPNYYRKTGNTVNVYTGTWSHVPGTTTYYDADGGSVVNDVLLSTNEGTWYYQNGTATYSTSVGVAGVYTYYTDNTLETEAVLNINSYNRKIYYYDTANSTYVETTSFVDGVDKYYCNNGSAETPAYTEINVNQISLDSSNGTYYYSGPGYTSTTKLQSGVDTYYHESGGTYTAANQVSFSTQYWYVSGTTDEYVRITTWDPTETYYAQSGTTYTVATPTSFKHSYWYFSGTTDEYASITTWDPSKTYYTKNESWDGTVTYSVASPSFNTTYYYFLTTSPNYSSACDNAYNPATTYYTDGNGQNVASTVNFDGTYYYKALVTTTTTATAEDIATYNYQQKTYATESEGTYTTVSTVSAGTSYYEVTSEGSSDLYGDLFTVPSRNDSWQANGGYVALEGTDASAPSCGDYYYGELAYWPPGYWQDADQTYGNSPYAGVKQFLLVDGYTVSEEEPTPVVPVEHIKKDVWYTACFPFPLTEVQINTTFGPNSEVAEFYSVTPRTDGTPGVIFVFKTNKTSKAMMAHKAYMIHPASGRVDAYGNPAETTFTLVGLDVDNAAFTADPSTIFYVNRTNGNAIANPGKAVTSDAIGETHVEGVNGNSFKTGDNFVFTATTHHDNYNWDLFTESNGTNRSGTRILTPQWSFFLGTKAGETYPRFFRQAASEDADRDAGLWRKNTAIILPPGSTYNDADTTRIMPNAFTNADPSYSYMTFKSGYTCPKYVYQDKEGVGNAKAQSSIEIMIVDDWEHDGINGETTGITELKDDEEEISVPKRLQGRVFSISGQYMGNSLKGLAPGVYIVDGKKYLVK